jgi:hypothetical protein
LGDDSPYDKNLKKYSGKSVSYRQGGHAGPPLRPSFFLNSSVIRIKFNSEHYRFVNPPVKMILGTPKGLCNTAGGFNHRKEMPVIRWRPEGTLQFRDEGD